jgi:AraC-like DNA-binding protein
VSISPAIVRAVAEVAAHAGVGRAELLATARIDPGLLEAVDARIDFDDFARFQTVALDLTGDEALGLHVAENATEASFDLVAHLIAHAPTLRAGLELALQFQRIFTDDSQLTLTEDGDLARMRLDYRRATPRSDRMHAEFVMVGVLRLVRTFAGPVPVYAARFEHPRPDHHHEYWRVFGGAERFGQALTAIDLQRKILERPGQYYHAELYDVLRAQAERALLRLTRGVSHADRLRQYLLAHPPIGATSPDMPAVARELGMSVRSLRRRLADEGASYKDLLDEALAAVAMRMLGDPRRTIQEIAHAMGFSDPSAFHRAFKRWTGMTPLQYRSREQA